MRLDDYASYTQKHAVEAIIVHQNFEGATLTNDIALLRVINPVSNLKKINIRRFFK